MTQTEFDIESAQRQSYSLGLSVGLHAVILFIMLFNFSWATDKFDKTPPAVLMIDLSKVELGDKTNLPPEVKKKAPPKPAVQPKKETPKKEASKTTTKTPPVKQEVSTPKPEQVKPVEKKTPKDAVKVKEKAKPKVKEKVKKKTLPKKEIKPTPKKPAPKKTVSNKPVSKQTAGLQSLLASVEKVRKPANPVSPTETNKTPDTGLEINKGIKGGIGGSRMEALTISEKDLIANKIRECWNVNAGVEGAEEMIIEIRAKVNRDGRIQDVQVLNMKNDPVFRSMADSARRAIYICDSHGSESPFKMLADKRPEHYSQWKEIYLRMNPIDKGVF